MAVVNVSLLDSNTVIDSSTPGVVVGEMTTINIVGVSSPGEHTITIDGLTNGATIQQAAGVNIDSSLNLTAQNGSVVSMDVEPLGLNALSGATYTVSDSSTISIDSGSLRMVQIGTPPTVTFTGDEGGTFIWQTPLSFLNTTDINVTGLGVGDTIVNPVSNILFPEFIDLGGGNATLIYSGPVLTEPINFHITGMDPTLAATIAADPSAFINSQTGVFVVPCFVSGTRIRTTRGEVAVEDLRAGDLAVTSSGKARPIVWIGHRRIERPAPEAWPVRVMAGAFGDNLPVRDLFLSSGHAVCVDMAGEVFVPVGQLVNGSTIDWVEVPEVTYWHVELESHDVLLAEGMPCESFMDAGNGAFFGRAYGRFGKVDPQRVAESLARYARPFVDGGLIVEAIRERLACRAVALTPKQESKAA
jgi:hypothetical protein